MPRKAEGLSAAKVLKAGPGRYGDGAGLYLLVREPQRKGNVAGDEPAELGRFWLFRYVRGGRMREMGLGPASGRAAVSLADARRKVRRLYDMVREGRDPLAEKVAARAAAAVEAAKAITFKKCGELYIDAHRAGWRNAKHARQWTSTLETYVYPIIGSLPVQTVDTGLVLKCLEPIWTTKTETASRVRGRIESILDWATASTFRSGDNPARWKGHLEHLLPKRSAVAEVEHHAALPYAEMSAFMAELRAIEGTVARALEFTILTAARTGEVIGAKRAEIDLDAKVWVVPAERMKAKREHRVPLSRRAIEIVKSMGDSSDGYLFPGTRPGRPLSNMAFLMLLRRMGRGDLTAHGFRSTFRDWAAERTSYPSEVAEMALAHTVADKVEAAYRRGDMFQKRLRFMDEWAKFCAAAPAKADNVATLRSRRQ